MDHVLCCHLLNRPDCVASVNPFHAVLRSSVTRMSSDQKQSVIMKTSEEERSTLDANLTHLFPKDEESQQVTLLVPIAESGIA